MKYLLLLYFMSAMHEPVWDVKWDILDGHIAFLSLCVQMWLFQCSHDNEPNELPFSLLQSIVDDMNKESKQGEATVKPCINLVYLCHSSSPGHATHSLSDEHTGNNANLSCSRYKHTHTQSNTWHNAHIHSTKYSHGYMHTKVHM